MYQLPAVDQLGGADPKILPAAAIDILKATLRKASRLVWAKVGLRVATQSVPCTSLALSFT